MRAILYDQFGPPSVLREGEAPKPEPKKDQVLIRVRAAGVDPIDWKIRSGKAASRFNFEFPITPGWECAGEIESLNQVSIEEEGTATEDLPPWKHGTRVLVYSRDMDPSGGRKPFVHHGCYAEYVAVPAEHVATLPPGIDFVTAGAIPLAGLTALQSLEALDIGPDKTVLIQAAAGGVGHLAVQLAKLAGANVIGTASEKNHEWLKKLGADELIDYTHHDFAKAVRKKHPKGIDAVLDCIGGETLMKGLDLLKDGGRIVSLVQPVDGPEFKREGRKAIYVFVNPNGAELWHLATLLRERRLKPRIAHELPLSQAARAHELIEGGHTAGKIVLTI